MSMDTVALAAVLVFGLCAGQDGQLQCPAEGCSNFTIYLGPKWGLQVIKYRIHPTAVPPEQEVSRIDSVTGKPTEAKVLENVIKNAIWADASEEGLKLSPAQRPIPPDNSVMVEYDDDREETVTANTRNWSTINVTDMVTHAALNLSGIGLSGEEVKGALFSLREDSARDLTRFYLSHNTIRALPVLTFPVGLEYGLQELSLDNNPLRYLDSDTRFELSRLRTLKKLSLARTYLGSLESLHLPTLEFLDLSGNRLLFIPQCLGELPNLLELHLNNNHISYVFTTPALPRLRVLNLASNGLTTLNPTSFDNLNVMKTLYLNNNSLTSASQVNMFAASTIFLSDNPWQCGCPLLSACVHSWANVADIKNITCVEGQHSSSRQVTSHDVHVDCPSLWRRLSSTWQSTARSYLDYAPTLFTLCLLVGVLLVIMQATTNSRKTKVPAEVPYNVLDDKTVV